MARLMRYQDLANATLHGSDPVAMNGPILADVKFPDVLVAKAYPMIARVWIWCSILGRTLVCIAWALRG